MIFPPPAATSCYQQGRRSRRNRLRNVVRITALSHSTIHRRIAEGRFPTPFSLGGKAYGWAGRPCRGGSMLRQTVRYLAAASCGAVRWHR